jgi:outer membrane protein
MGGISFATNHDYEHRMILGLTQPLLRGLGSSVTNADIRIAQLARAGAAADFQTALEDNLVLSLTTYWNLIGAIENWKVQVISYSAATDLLRVNRAKYEAEVIAVTDVLQAEAAAEGRRSVVISARQSVRDLEDQLTQLIFINGDRPMWGTELEPTQPIDWREIDIDLGGALATATARRAELRSATSDIAQAETRRRVARNARLPQLDVFGQIDANGQAEQNEDALDETTKHNNYSVGLQFSYPLQNRRARHALRQAETAVAQREEAARATSDQIAFEVRTAWRNLRTAREQIDVTGSQVRSEEAKLESELRRYEVGTSTAFQVLDFQEDLAAAQSSHITAVVAYNQAAIQLDRARGTLLETYAVTVEDANLTPPVEPVDSFPIGSE